MIEEMIRCASASIEPERTFRWMRGLAQGLGELIAPSRCLECGAVAPDGWACRACADGVRWWDDSWCPSCAVPEERHHAPYCRIVKKASRKAAKSLAPWTECRVLGAYQGVLRSACLTTKKADGAWLVEPLADAWSAKHADWANNRGPCLLVPVPRHWSRRWVEGHDPAAQLARCLSKMLRNASVSGHRFAPILKRTRATPRLSNLDASERVAVLAGLFAVTRSGKSMLAATPHVILVDDICTTGATAISAALCLKDAGAKQVELVTLARTLEGSG